jgi:hypothetical protein
MARDIKSIVRDMIWMWADKVETPNGEQDFEAPQPVYQVCFDMVKAVFGNDAADRFSRSIKASDNGYYLRGYWNPAEYVKDIVGE